MHNYKIFLEDLNETVLLIQKTKLIEKSVIDNLNIQLSDLEQIHTKLITSIPYRIYTAEMLRKNTLSFIKDLNSRMKELTQNSIDNKLKSTLIEKVKSFESISNAGAMDFSCMKALSSSGRTMDLESNTKQLQTSGKFSTFLKICSSLFSDKTVTNPPAATTDNQYENPTIE
jgi:hypothetical protein